MCVCLVWWWYQLVVLGSVQLANSSTGTNATLRWSMQVRVCPGSCWCCLYTCRTQTIASTLFTAADDHHKALRASTAAG